jgi:hypothetical protein
MNTTEINGSAWSIRYYVIVSVPLILVTLLVPLVSLQMFNSLVLSFQTSPPFRRAIKWGWISAAFIFELLSVVLPVTNTASLVAGPVSSSIVSFAAFTYTIKNSIAFKNMTQNKGLPHEGFRRAPISNHQLWFLFCFVTLALQLAKIHDRGSGFRYVPLAPFIIYFCIVGYRLSRKIYCTYTKA